MGYFFRTAAIILGGYLTGCAIAICVVILLISAPNRASFADTQIQLGQPVSTSGTVPFVMPTGDVLHYISVSGSDSNNGLSPATAWKTPNHAMHCGDAIIAAAGTYTGGQFSATFGAVTNCPSTTGGIDGTGGIYDAVVLCAGPDLNSCIINTSANGFDINVSNWAAEGFSVGDATHSTGGLAYEATCNPGFPCNAGATTTGYIAFINDLANNGQQGYAFNDGASTHGAAGHGVDEGAVIGSYGNNVDQDGLAVSIFDNAGPANLDGFPGTHFIFAGNFGCCGRGTGVSDVQNYIFDTWDDHNYTGNGVILNNVSWDAGGDGIALFYQALGTTNYTGTVSIGYNTSYGSNQQALSSYSGTGSVGELNFQSSSTMTTNVFNNIMQSSLANSGGNASFHTVYAMELGGNYAITTGGTGLQNVFSAIATNCQSSCDPGHNVNVYNVSWASKFAANFYQSPAFKNVSDLMTNHTAYITCAGFASVTACMGYNGTTVASGSVIDDLTPTASNTSNAGYQLPGPCVTSGPFHDLFPTWLKGLVYLQWNGSSVVQHNTGMLTLPCGM